MSAWPHEIEAWEWQAAPREGEECGDLHRFRIFLPCHATIIVPFRGEVRVGRAVYIGPCDDIYGWRRVTLEYVEEALR